MTELLSEVFSVTELNNSVLSDFNRAWILVVTIAVVILLCLAILALIKGAIFYVYLKCSNEKVQEAVKDAIFQLDAVADNLSNKEKRRSAIETVRSLFMWKAIPIPTCVIGLIIDLEVKIIRIMQKNVAAYKNPYLHPDNEGDDVESSDEGKK